jgi:hypothetical protein
LTVSAGCLVHFFIIHSIFQLLFTTYAQKTFFAQRNIGQSRLKYLSIPEPRFTINYTIDEGRSLLEKCSGSMRDSSRRREQWETLIENANQEKKQQ